MSENAQTTETQEPSATALGLFDTLQDALVEAKALGQEFFVLLAAELSLAVSSIPKLIIAGLASLFFMATSWLAICTAIAFISYSATGVSWLPFVIFAVLQLIALAACKVLIARCKEYLSLPYSRRFLNELKRGGDEAES